MNRPLSFSISLAGHTLCVGLMLMTCKATRESPVVEAPVPVTLLPPAMPVPPAPHVERAERPTPTRETRPTPVTPRESFKPVFVERKVTISEPRKVEQTNPPKLVDRLKKEKVPPSVRAARAIPGEAGVSVLAGTSWQYDSLVASYIKSNWIRPSRAVVGDSPPAVKVAIRIATDGRITKSQVAESSGVSALDASALDAIRRSNPLPMRLPSYMARRSYDVTIEFCITDEV